MNVFKEKFSGWYTKITHDNRLLSLAVVITLALTIPPTLSVSQKFLDIRQHADSYPATLSLSPSNIAAGDTLKVTWNISQSTTLTGSETLQLIKFSCTSSDCYKGRSLPNSLPPTITVETIFFNCRSVYMGTDNPDTSVTASPQYTGECGITTPTQAAAGIYIVRMYAADGTTILGESNTISLTGSYESDDQPLITAFPNPCLLTDYGTCSSMISWSVPKTTNAADVTVRIKGLKNTVFANAPYGIVKAGWITAGGVTFELYNGSSEKPISSVFVKGVNLLPTPENREAFKPATPSAIPAEQDVTTCTKDSDCASEMKCFKYQDYAGTCRPKDTVCTQALTTACYQREPNCSGQNTDYHCTNVYYPQQCVEFPNTCVIPPGWTRQ